MDELLKALKKLVGKTTSYRGCYCCVVDVVPEGPAVVLCEKASEGIQPDQFGEAHRRCHQTHTVAVYNRSTHSLHPLIERITNPGEARRILRLSERTRA